MSVNTNRIVVQNTDELAVVACSFISIQCDSALKTRDRFTLALPGGLTPKTYFPRFLLNPRSREMNWQKTELFWTDERCVPPSDPRSNFHLAENTFLRQMPIPPEQIRRIPAEQPDPDTVARQYEQNIRQTVNSSSDIPAFDLVVLGLGTDGHIASLFPHHPALNESTRLVLPVANAPDVNRITLTAPLLNRAHKILIVAFGPEKADIIRTVFTEQPDPRRWPVHLLWPSAPRMTWLLDRHAAQYL